MSSIFRVPGRWVVGAVVIAALGVSSSAGASGGPVVGAMGDSLTDEYAEGEFSYALNWLQQVVVFRDVEFGLTAAEANQPGGTWGEPRRTQYEYNWARHGATSATLLTDGQHTGLASQVGPLGIDYTLLGVGANDFSPALGTAYFSIYWNLWSSAQQQSYINNIASRISTAMDTVLAEGSGFVLANVPDYGVTPIVRQFFPNASRRQNVTNVINQLNAMIAGMAAEREIVMIDLAGMSTAIFGTNFALNETLLLGNVPIYLWESDTIDNTHRQAAFVHDGAHPHTTLHGLFANVIIAALNMGYGEQIELFTESEILGHAGIAYGGADTLASQVGAFADYVHDFTPVGEVPGDLNGDGVVDVSDLLILLGAWGACPANGEGDCPADFNGDGVVDVSDLLILLASWG